MNSGWNLIGYSSDVGTALSNALFINSSGSSYTWANAVANNKVQGYLGYWNSNAQANLSKYKYLSALSGLDATAFENQRGYWIYSNVSGNLTLPEVGGSLAGGVYDWDKLRFSNGTMELDIVSAGNATYGWVDTTYVQYWDTDVRAFRYVCSAVRILGGDLDCLKSSFESYKGYFVNSLQDNVTLIRQN